MTLYSYISNSGEFRRIRALPRRIWDTEPDVANKQTVLTHYLKTPLGSMMLRKIQAAALWEIALYGGAFLPIGVGQGKALISLLAAAVVPVERPVLFVPADLRGQTNNLVIPEMVNHWRLPALKIIGYSEVSLIKNVDMLDELNPDLIILDECHSVSRKNSARTRRFTRWFDKYPETKCVAMSGTVSKRSLKDFAHIISWCLGQGSPVPLHWHELSDWADCIDVDVPEEQRPDAGVLSEFCEPHENVRQGFQRRFTQTPGVVASKGGQIGTSLRIVRKALMVPDKIEKMIKDMRSSWITPNGDIVTEAIALSRHVKELSLGFWYYWDPPAPLEWMDVRRTWKSYVRETIKYNRRGLDTELQVWNECKFKTPNFKPWVDWCNIKASFKPNTVAIWENDFALNSCKQWLESRKGDNPGICWTEHDAFGKKLSEVSGATYFGAGDDRILVSKENACIASRPAHRQGKNLQHFNSNLVVCPSPSGQVWEQLLGRTHRQGQKAATVTCDVFLHLHELQACFERAQNDARYLEDTFGNQQKLNYADMVM